MHIESILTHIFPVPFKTVIRHASASRRRAANLIVCMKDREGHVGYGEGCPRDYVSGETVASAAHFVRAITANFRTNVRDMASLRLWIADNTAAIDANPAAFCAVELAFMDLLGRAKRQSIETLLGLPNLSEKIQYTAVLGDSFYPVFCRQLARYRANGMTSAKLKLSGQRRRDRRRLRNLARSGFRTRLDANNRWVEPRACIDSLPPLPASVWAIEEPLQAGNIDGFAEIGGHLGRAIILDESLLGTTDLYGLPGGVNWIANVRVSKLGGLCRSMAVIAEARLRNIPVIVGAQVGETAILTRAGWTAARAAGDNLLAVEGAFGTHLLAKDICHPSPRFEGKGVLYPAKYIDPDDGLGLKINGPDLFKSQNGSIRTAPGL